MASNVRVCMPVRLSSHNNTKFCFEKLQLNFNLVILNIFIAVVVISCSTSGWCRPCRSWARALWDPPGGFAQYQCISAGLKLEVWGRRDKPKFDNHSVATHFEIEIKKIEIRQEIKGLEWYDGVDILHEWDHLAHQWCNYPMLPHALSQAQI